MSSHSSKAVLWINVGLMTAFIVVGTAFRTQLLLSNRSLWFDAAALAVNTVEAGYGELLPPLHYMSQTAPVGFMVATKAISRVFEYTEFSLLALPFAMGVLSLVLMGLLAWRLLPRTVMFLPVAFLSLSSTAIYYSAEYKSYSCDLFFSLLIVLSALSVMEHRWRLGRVIMFGLCALMSVLFSYAAVIVLCACGLVLLSDISWNRDQKKQPILVFFLIGAVCAVVWASLYGPYSCSSARNSVTEYHSYGFVPIPLMGEGAYLWHLRTIRGLFEYPLGFHRETALMIILLLGGFLLFVRHRGRSALLVVLPLVLLYVLSALHLYPLVSGEYEINSRLIVFTAPAFYILLAYGIHELFWDKCKPAFFFACAFLLLGQYWKASTPDRYMREETRELVRYIIQNREEADLVYVHPKAEPAFLYYTRHNHTPYVTQPVWKEQTSRLQDSNNLSTAGETNVRTWLLFSHTRESAEQEILASAQQKGAEFTKISSPGASLYLSKGNAPR